MEQPIIIVTVLTLISVIVFVFLYVNTEKKKKVMRENELTELKEFLKTEVNNLLIKVQTKMDENATQSAEKFDAFTKDVRNSQDQIVQKINLGFEQLHNGNTSIKVDIGVRNEEIKKSLNDYSEKVKETLDKLSNDNLEFRRTNLQVKEQIEKELQDILREIKSPLDLD